MSDNNDNNQAKQYTCNLCNKQFTNRKNLWAHKNKTKNPCITKEECEELIQQVYSKDSRINYLKEKAEQTNQELEKHKKEIEYLKQLLEKNDLLKEMNNQHVEMVEQFNDKLDQVIETVEKKNNTFTCNQNLNMNVINNLSHENKNNIINIEFSKPKQEKLDHITHDMMMNILDQKNYNTSVSKLMQSIYFHPEAPQNWNWCVTDCDLQLGVLQFDHESGNLQRENTEHVIQKRYANVMFRVVDMLDELRRERNMNKPQAINCSRLCNSLGTQLDSSQIQEVKKIAYSGRNLSKSLWEYLGIVVETTPIHNRITMTTTHSSH